MAIKYEAYTWSGEKVTGVLETYSEEDAYEMLRQDELVPYRLETVRERRTLVQIVPRLFPARPQDLIDFTQQVSSLLKSGIPLRLALQVQRDQTRNLGLKTALGQIVKDVEGGNRLSEALARHSSVFPNFYIRLLGIGEAAGGVIFTLDQLHETMVRRKSVNDRVKSALTYPAISLVLAGVAALILIKYSLPSLIGLLDEFGGELPFATRLLITISDFLQEYILYSLFAIGATVALSLIYMRTPTGTKIRDNTLLRLPMVGNVMMTSNMFMLTSTFVTLLEAGIAPIEALRLTSQGMVNVAIREKLDIATEMAEGGSRLAEAFGQQKIFPTLLSQALAVGEMRGTQVDTLHGLADYFERQTEKAIGLAMEMIQPLVITLVAALVGFVAVAVISGIYSTLNSIE